MNVLDARHDPHMLGGLRHHRDPATQERWDAMLAATYGLPLTDAQLQLFRLHTARADPRPGGYPQAITITGRQGGKTQTAGDVVAYEAAAAPRDGSADGTYALLVAQDQRGTLRTLFSYVATAFDQSPLLRQCVVSKTAETIVLDNGVCVAVYPCRPQAIRGIRARVAVVDELAFFRTSENLPTDVEMLRSVRPTLATTGGRLIILSSPYGQTGALWDLHRAHYGRADSSTLVWCGSAPAMNPMLPADYLARMQEDDAEAYRSEVLGEFRTGVATFIDPDALQACVVDRRELLPAGGVHYVAFADPAGGGGRDAYGLAVAHMEGARVVVDCVRAWSPPFNPATVTAEAAHLLKSFGIYRTRGDRFAGLFPRQLFAAHGITYEVCPMDRSALYLELLPKINAQAVELPNDPALLRELRGLERRRGFAGKDRVDHRPGSHDDRANCVAGVAQFCRRSALGRSELVGDV